MHKTNLISYNNNILTNSVINKSKNIYEELNINVASSYIVMAAELMEIKSASLLPKNEIVDDEYEEDPRESLIKRLLEYEQYKNYYCR